MRTKAKGKAKAALPLFQFLELVEKRGWQALSQCSFERDGVLVNFGKYDEGPSVLFRGLYCIQQRKGDMGRTIDDIGALADELGFAVYAVVSPFSLDMSKAPADCDCPERWAFINESYTTAKQRDEGLTAEQIKACLERRDFYEVVPPASYRHLMGRLLKRDCKHFDGQ